MMVVGALEWVGSSSTARGAAGCAMRAPGPSHHTFLIPSSFISPHRRGGTVDKGERKRKKETEEFVVHGSCIVLFLNLDLRMCKGAGRGHGSSTSERAGTLCRRCRGPVSGLGLRVEGLRFMV